MARQSEASYLSTLPSNTDQDSEPQQERLFEETLDGAHCFHCLEPVPRFGNLSAEVDGRQQAMCCIGCKAAAEFICERGLTKFYTHRDRFDHRDFYAQVAHQNIRAKKSQGAQLKWSFLDSPESAKPYVSTDQHGNKKLTIIVDGLYCRSCTWLIEKALHGLSTDLVIHTDVDARTLHVEIPAKNVHASEVVTTVERLGYTPTVAKLGDVSTAAIQVKQQRNKALTRIIVAGLGMMQVMTYATAGYFGSSLEPSSATTMSPELERFFLLLSMLVATVVVFYAGKPFFDNALNDLKNRHAGMDVPVALAIAGAYFPSVWAVLNNSNTHVYFDSAVMFVFFLSVSRYVEMQARHKLSGSGTDVQMLLPSTIEVQRIQNGKLEQRLIEPTTVLSGDIARLTSLQVIPFDAVIQSGTAMIDQSHLTGEASGIKKQRNDKLIAGSKVLSGSIEIKATASWAECSIAKIEHTIRRAQRSSEQEDQRSHLISQYFITTVLALTLIVAGIWLLIAPQRVFEICLAMLIATCPCAFTLAAPATRSAATHALRRFGVLLTNNTALMRIANITHWCFDKTGTLTRGRPSIHSVYRLSEESQQQCLQLAASLEQNSEHVLANAFDSIHNIWPIQHVDEVVGQGVSARIKGETYFLGRRSWVIRQLLASNNKLTQATIEALLPDKNHLSEVVLGTEEKLLAAIFLEDVPRRSARSFICTLIKRNQGVAVLSGDHQAAVAELCRELNIDEYHADLSPNDKLDLIHAKQRKGECVAMTGDGINDAPVLAAADISITMASGSTLALNNSDVVLLNGNLSSLNSLRTIGQKARQVTQQNYAWALAYNVCVLPLAASGLLTPWLAALGMSLSSLLVVLNALRVNVKP